MRYEMQSVSSDFLTAADATIRKPIGKLEITWTDPIVDPGMIITSDTSNRGSQDEQIADTISDPSFKYCILDGTWALNEDYHLAPQTSIEVGQYQIGYCGNQVSDSFPASQAFPTEEKVLIEFTERSIQGIYVIGDKLLNQYPREYEIFIRNGSTQLGYFYEPFNINVENFYFASISGVDNIELVIYSWSAPNTCCKIVEFSPSFVATYYGNDIISIDVLEEREIRDATLPIGNISSNEINIAIQNYTYGYGEWVAVGQVMTIKSNVQDVTTWDVYVIIYDGPQTYIDTYTCPFRSVNGGYEWTFVYQYTIPSQPDDYTIQLYFEPSGADVGKPGAFYSDRWTIKTLLIDPYHPDNTDSLFYSLLRPNRRIKAYLGFILPNGAYEYATIGTFWSNDWIVKDDTLELLTNGRDRLGVLQDKIYDGSVLWEAETLYDIADDVLSYAKAHIPMPDLSWSIDSSLSAITVPYAYFDKISYFEVLELISKLCIGQCYMSKDDVLILSSYTSNTTSAAYDALITKDDYFNITQDMNYLEVKNKINVSYKKYELLSLTEIYRSSEAITIAASETLDPIIIEYSNPVKGGSASIVEQTGGVSVSIIDDEYYSWGAIITCQNTVASSGTFKIAIDGQELSELDTLIVSVQNDNSINLNTLSEYSLPENYLIQDEVTALEIANGLLSVYEYPRNIINIDYRGNPAIELADIVRVTVYKRNSTNILKDFKIYKGSLNFDGTLKGQLLGRYIEPAGVGDVVQDSDTGTYIYQDSDNATTYWQDGDY